MISRSDIEAAAERVRPYLRETPVLEVEGEVFGAACPLSLKLELMQHTGSFKPRGAFNSLLSREISDAGVVAVSGGNHGAAVAYAARTLGYQAKVFVPEFVDPTKAERIRKFGAEVMLAGGTFSQTVEAYETYVGTSGATPIHPYDDVETVTGQGTLGREIERQLPDIDVLLVSVGGGGLIGGICAWFDGRVRIVPVETEGTATLANALKHGVATKTEISGIAAGALGAQTIGRIAYEVVRERAEHVVLVSDDDVIEAQRRLWDAARLVAEPGGVTALAALTSGAYRAGDGDRVAVLVCGGNSSPGWFLS